ncbi:hypothetical protein Poli38472_009311 [Pythium oligandrum]|uniref:Uncharacterized protein n=1 Tax=Pythium oligandrum TaxID=41045 RepID=A0A8K1FLD2_PYTOL|nr:hypothetical protein Poli38472_009311 [Pythium oligandrum]|eukprot:TMW65144.1 hypothetical protein Poli38472_009311 [Pythium oligandrum]
MVDLVRCVAFLAASWTLQVHAGSQQEYPIKSGIKMWVDPATPSDRQAYTNSRGRTWELVMSDEFNEPGRDFRPGKDHLWTSLEKPDGVNGAKELYSHNMTSTECDDKGNCYYYIKIIDDPQSIRTYNMYLNPPAFETVEFQYRAAMVQSWNKFCFQGGLVEVRAQLPGAVTPESGNPDLALGPTGKTKSIDWYPTWPGIWMMGNLGRAIFSASTNRMWPFSYDKCEPDVFDPDNQRISACDSNPGYGLNPNQGRGAPEIDLLEGGGTDISSSLQIAPGMPMDFRLVPPDGKKEKDGNIYCLYSGECKTIGANHPGVPSSFFNARGHKSWYQGLRYSTNPFCASDPAKKQNYATVAASIKAGIKDNVCTPATCPGSKDAYADLGLIDGTGPEHWGINTNGTCFPVMNAYMGSYLCDPDNQHKLCGKPRPDNVTASNIMKPFNYQMDAISSNWPVHLGAYTDFLVYQVEWVTGKKGYVRWMLDGHPIFEITADAFSNVPQDSTKSNPQKVMLEEPMYLIFNVALSTSWGSKPPNPGKPCRGDGKDPKTNKICDAFPMYMKIDYIRLYQDLGTDLDDDNLMQIGCDPESHPTREWILGHIDEYEDHDNKMVDVPGGAYCTVDDDCTIAPKGSIQFSRLVTGECVNKRCKCTHGESWGGPRCNVAVNNSLTKKKVQGFGPPFGLAIALAALVMILTFVAVWYSMRKAAMEVQAALTKNSSKKDVHMSPNDAMESAGKSRYSQNFVHELRKVLYKGVLLSPCGADTTVINVSRSSFILYFALKLPSRLLMTLLELKAFVHESVHALDDAQLRLLSETLRVDLRGCDDRVDIERVLTGLLCLDQDTSLGTFLAWLRKRETQHSLVAKKTTFVNTFVPVIASPRRSNQEPVREKTASILETVKEHHLNDEISQRLNELTLLEQEFKDAERHVHNGAPTFEKLKTFVVKLTRLRSKEEEVRKFFIKQSEILTEQHAQMKAETLHTRAQLDFFVDGFTNLRHRHDELLDKSTKMKAENEVVQDIFLSMSVQESHFGEILHRTLLHQLNEKAALEEKLRLASEEISVLKTKQSELEALISQLKRQRGEAAKDANCYKLQLRKCKEKMQKQAINGPDCAYFRQQAMQMRTTLTSVVSLFRETIARDTKSVKQSVSKEIVKSIQRLNTPPSISKPSVSQPIRVVGAAPVDVADSTRQVARVLEKPDAMKMDIDEAVRGVVLLGGQEGEAEQCATNLSTKFKYIAVDLKTSLVGLEQEARRSIQKQQDELALIAPETTLSVSPPTLSIENYATALRDHLNTRLVKSKARGMVLYNWEMTGKEVNVLIAMGFPIDSVIELQIPPPKPPSAAPTPVPTPLSSAPSTAKSVASSSKTSGASSRTSATPQSRTGSKPSTPSKATLSRQSRSPEPKKAPTPATPASRTTTSKSPVMPSAPKLDRKTVFAGMPHLFSRLEPVTFVEDRVEQIVDTLQHLKEKKATPFVQWDEATQQTNEALMMWAEDLLTMIWNEQESRKPKKPEDLSPKSRSRTAQRRKQMSQHRNGEDVQVPRNESDVNIGEMVDIPVEDNGQRLAPPPRPTIVQLPSRSRSNSSARSPARPEPLPPAAPASSSAAFVDIDPNVLNELPPEIQQEILLEQAAAQKRANDTAIQEAMYAASSESSRDASFGDTEPLRPASSPRGWICHVCTFENHPQLFECEMCETPCVPEDMEDWDDEDGEMDELRGHSRRGSSSTSTPLNRSRSNSATSDLYSKISKKVQASAMSKSLKKIRVPATPAMTTLTQKDEPTAEDLLIVAKMKIESLQSSASQSLQHAKQTIMGKSNSAKKQQLSTNGHRLKAPSAQAAAILNSLQRDLNTKCVPGDDLYETLLVRLWNAIYLDAPRSPRVQSGATQLSPLLPLRPFERISEGWLDIGFQGTNPDTDFRGGGILALKCLVYVFEAFPDKMLQVVSAQRPTDSGKKWYPVTVAGINLTCMIAGLLRLGNGMYDQYPEAFWALFEEPAAFYQLFYHAFVKMDAAWHRTNASFMEFGVVLKATRRMIVYMLDQAPETLDDLRVAAEKTFIDRFVVSVSSAFLADTENGECPDPFNLLEDENEVLLTSPRTAVSSATHKHTTGAPAAPLR